MTKYTPVNNPHVLISPFVKSTSLPTHTDMELTHRCDIHVRPLMSRFFNPVWTGLEWQGKALSNRFLDMKFILHKNLS